MLQDYHLVKHRRNGSTIYRCNHYTHYMKVGSNTDIEQEVQLYLRLKAFGIPLPTLLGFETNEDDLGWMKEESLQGTLYADLFTDSYEKNNCIANDLFDSFITYQLQHIAGQAQTMGTDKIVNTPFSKYDFLYSEGYISHDLITQTINRIEQDTKGLPQGRNHGDHNPYNIFNDGVIDLEDSFLGPIGYDTITSLTQNFWFPYANQDACELSRQHVFSPMQIQEYITKTSDNILKISFSDSHIFGSLFIMRGIFTTVQSDSTPHLQKYRYQRLQQAMEAYCGGENMVEYFLQHY